MKNPIKNNRIISDKTFAVRLLSFLESTEVYDLCSEEERDYLIYVAKSLRKYQVDTCTSEEEIAYFKNLGIEIKPIKVL